MKKGNTPLRQTIDYALAAIAARGTYSDLYLKYFPLGFFLRAAAPIVLSL